MIKTFVQLLGGLCLFLAVLLFPTKIGIVISEVVEAAWNIVVTVGKNVRVPGEKAGTILTFAGFVAPGIAQLFKDPNTTNKRNLTMMKTIIQFPTTLLVKTQTFATQAQGVALVATPSDRTGRLQTASAALVGMLLLFTTEALAAPQGKGRQGIVDLIASVTGFILLIVSAAVVLMAAWGAFLYITAGGSQNRVQQAKTTVKNVFIGLALAASIFLARQVVLDIVGGVDKTGGGGGGVRSTLGKGEVGR